MSFMSYPSNIPPLPSAITLHITRGSLLERALHIMQSENCTMGEALDKARAGR